MSGHLVILRILVLFFPLTARSLNDEVNLLQLRTKDFETNLHSDNYAESSNACTQDDCRSQSQVDGVEDGEKDVDEEDSDIEEVYGDEEVHGNEDEEEEEASDDDEEEAARTLTPAAQALLGSGSAGRTSGTLYSGGGATGGVRRRKSRRSRRRRSRRGTSSRVTTTTTTTITKTTTSGESTTTATTTVGTSTTTATTTDISTTTTTDTSTTTTATTTDTSTTTTTTTTTPASVCGPCSVVFSQGYAPGYGDTQGPTNTMTTMNQWVPSYSSGISSLILSGQGCQLQVETTSGVQSYIYTPGVYNCGTLPDGSPSPQTCLPTGNDNMVASIMTCQGQTTTTTTTTTPASTTTATTTDTSTTTT